MGHLNSLHTDTVAARLTSDQAALERAGKKEVLKVELHLCVSNSQFADYHIERMELLGCTRLLHRDLGDLGGYERAIRRCLHQRWPCFRDLWLHHLRAGHSRDRSFNG